MIYDFGKKKNYLLTLVCEQNVHKVGLRNPRCCYGYA